MKIEKFQVKGCTDCGGKISTIYKLDRSVSKDFMASLIGMGFAELEHFTKSGILYVENPEFIVTGPFGADRIQIKCRIANCQEKLSNFEALLSQM
jgi:hypothetical protein